MEVMNDEAAIDLKRPSSREQANATEARISAAVRFVIAATFTADPLERPLKFWMNALDIPAEIVLASYAQVLQELLNPESLVCRNIAGFNILLIRMEDWIRERRADDVDGNIAHLRRVAHELMQAVSVMRARTSATLFVFCCPASSQLPEPYHQPVAECQRNLIEALCHIADVHVWTHADITQRYPVSETEDPRTDRLAHIPYTEEYFVAVATLLARQLTGLIRPQYKVIAIDCDNTLWRGICGEDGAAGVDLTPEHVAFQRLLVAQHDAGMLLCLCSKNNSGDVEAVFRTRTEMPLREEHLICSRVNWQSKSSNLESLARELDLSMESFIFVDDSPLECEEVRKRCPGVLALQFPQTPAEIAHFIDHVWAFDRLETTKEAQQRTAQYRQNRARRTALRETADLQQFLASLELDVHVAPMQPEQLRRVAELVQRTNQFNLTTIRRRAAEIETFVENPEAAALTVHVRDRFGDYGLVGAVLLYKKPTAVEVDTFVLSCRVLGRGVEHRIVNEIGRVTAQEGLPYIVLKYRRTPRNEPAWEFLQTSFREFEPSTGDDNPAAERIFIVPVAHATKLSISTAATSAAGATAEKPASVPHSDTKAAGASWHDVAHRLSRVADIVQEIAVADGRMAPTVKASVKRKAGDSSDTSDSSRTPSEQVVAELFAEVLGLPQEQIDADFFDLGGDSLQAVRVIARIGSRLGYELSLHEFLDGPTVADVARKLIGAAHSLDAIPRADRHGRIPMSMAQQRLWFIHQLEGRSAAYDTPLALRLRGALDCTSLQRALDVIVNRHEVLRTVFVQEGSDGVPKIAPDGHFLLEFLDLRQIVDNETDALRHMREELEASFDLSVGPLIRGKLLRLANDDHVLFIIINHMVADGWSIGVLLRELGELYRAFSQGQSDPLSPLPIQYADYAHWQRKWLSGSEVLQQLSYWQQHLRGAPELLDLPTDRPRPATQSYRGSSIQLHLSLNLTTCVKALSRQINATVAMTLQAAWTILLSKLSGQHDVVIGVPVANRRRTELEGLIGFFVDTLAVRVQIEDHSTVAQLIQRIREVMLAAYAHQDVPFEKVVETLQPTRSLSHSPIFQVMFVLQNAPRGVMQFGDLALSEQYVPLQTAKFDVALELHEHSGGIGGVLSYATDLFDVSSMEKWGACLEVVLEAMVADPWQKVSQLSLMSAFDRGQVIEHFNATESPYPDNRLLHELFEDVVRRAPDAKALLDRGLPYTYAELNDRANQLARYLRTKELRTEQLVGVCTERGLEMVVGLLGVLKAGGAYLPLDPSYPAQRLAYMIRDAKPRIILTQRRLRELLPLIAEEVVAFDDERGEIDGQDTTNLDPRLFQLTPRSLAYVIYTSGSTGQPKGVAAEHRGMVNRIAAQSTIAPFRDGDICCQKTSIGFVDSIFEILGPLSYGYPLVLGPEALATDIRQLAMLIHSERITRLLTVPSLAHALIDDPQSAQMLQGLRSWTLSGEELTLDLLGKLRERLPECAIINLYGSSEIAADATYYVNCGSARLDTSIGRPIPNTRIYILDPYGQPVPIGVVGEIYVGGLCIARGYLNRPELTLQRFIPDPFGSDPQGRLYRTGDLARWRPNGTIEYFGRRDQQVKIRGFRIELGEIEAHLLRHPQVIEAAAVVREDSQGDKRLVAYVVPKSGADASAPATVESLRSNMKGALPDYMVPSAVIFMARLPLTPSGKLDRRSLPAPGLDAYTSRRYEPPCGPLEEAVASIWRSLLHVERIGRQENFFELGGHSLLIMELMERLRQAGLTTELRSVYESATLADLASSLAVARTERAEVPPNLIPRGCQSITPDMLPLVELDNDQLARIAQSVQGGGANIQDIYPLLPLQEGILFHHLLSGQKGDPYVVGILLAVSSRAHVDNLVSALQSVVDRHDVLRTAVLWEQIRGPVQVVYRNAALPVHEIALQPSRRALEQVLEWIEPERQQLDLRTAPSVRVQAAADPRSSRWYVLLQLHHIFADAQSLNIVVAEAVAHLEGHARDLPTPEPFRNRVSRSLAHARTHDSEAFFRSKLGAVDEPTAPFGVLDVHPAHISRGEEVRRALEPSVGSRVRTQARRFGVSSAILFHAAWGIVVAHTSGRDDVVFGTVLLGRLQNDSSTQGTLGMFINTLPLRLQLKDITVKGLLAQTQRELLELLEHEQSSLATAQRCSGVAAPMPLFTALLNYRHGVPDFEAQWSRAAGMELLAVQGGTNYPITLSVDDLRENFALTAKSHRLVDPQRLLAWVETVIRALVEALEQAPERPALALSMLSDSEQREVTEAFNSTSLPHPQGALIHQLFERQVERTPDAIALLYEGQSLTYSELNANSNQLARCLREKGVGPDSIVAICAERGLHMVTGLLGILKAGGAFLPLDPSYPASRLEYMLRDAAPNVVLSEQWRRNELPRSPAKFVALDGSWRQSDKYATSNLDSKETSVLPRHLAYVIYTSGSTGQPKGVMVDHSNLFSLWQGLDPIYRVSSGCKRVAVNASFNFDASIKQFVQLLSGRTIVLVPQSIRGDADAMLDFLERSRIDSIDCTPSQLKMWIASGLLHREECRLHVVLVGGEPIDLALWAILAKCSKPDFYNVYGPTESTVDATFARVNGGTLDAHIGCPMQNRRIYILDRSRRLLPVGVTGELYIGGAGIARGYLNRPDLTCERFLPDSFDAGARGRLYRTGDLGKWRADGTIEYVGRNDHQIKIRGMRIELAEIEAQLLGHECVRGAAVISREDVPGENRLVAYVVLHQDAAKICITEDLRAYLRSSLPEYMVPHAFVSLEQLPLTVNGKLDRRALPIPEHGAFVQRKYEVPIGEVEEILAEIWQELLALKRVGRHDDFFDLGGHSLLVLRLLARVGERFGCVLKVLDVYRSSTIEELAIRIGGNVADDEFVVLSKEASLDPTIVPTPGLQHRDEAGILLTGASGFVGRFLLWQLLMDTDARIYCLMRAPSEHDARSRLHAMLRKWNLWRDEFEKRVVAVVGDLRMPRLGLTDRANALLCREVTTIYHCATSMNHLETYTMSKAANVGSVGEILRLAVEKRPKVVNYISTLSVFQPLAIPGVRVVREHTPIDHEMHRHSAGYVASKWVAEKVLLTAIERGIQCNLFRLGLVWADTEQGRYDELQRVYRVIKSCLLSGLGIQDYRPSMAPMPVDQVARAVISLAGRHLDGGGIFHIASPNPMAEGLFEMSNAVAGTSLDLIPYYDWICAMKSLHMRGRSLPAVPLIEFAFSMDEQSFHDWYRKNQAASIHFDVTRTIMELECAGMVMPKPDGELLDKCVRDMRAREWELREDLCASAQHI